MQPSLDFTRPIIPPPFRDTSLEAADAMTDRAPILRARVLDVLATGNFTADEVAAQHWQEGVEQARQFPLVAIAEMEATNAD